MPLIHLYDYHSFFCFYTKIFHGVFSLNTFHDQDDSSQIFVSFKQPPQPPEPFASFRINVLFNVEFFVYFRPGGKAFWCVFCVLWLNFRVYSCPFVVDNQWLGNSIT